MSHTVQTTGIGLSRRKFIGAVSASSAIALLPVVALKQGEAKTVSSESPRAQRSFELRKSVASSKRVRVRDILAWNVGRRPVAECTVVRRHAEDFCWWRSPSEDRTVSVDRAWKSLKLLAHHLVRTPCGRKPHQLSIHYRNNGVAVCSPGERVVILSTLAALQSPRRQ